MRSANLSRKQSKHGLPAWLRLVACVWLVQLGAARTALANEQESSDAARSATCNALIHKEIENTQLAEPLLSHQSAMPAQTPKLRSDTVLIATLPDVDKTPAGEAFDGALGGLVSGMEQLGYIRDHAQLQRSDGSGPAKQLYAQHCPGIILFRARPTSDTNQGPRAAKAIAVLTVGENWHSGIDRLQLRNALELVETTRNAKVPILGPYYSASTDGFIGELNRRCAAPATASTCRDGYIAASGSMSAEAAIARIHRELEGLDYRPFTSTQLERRCAVYEWRAKLNGSNSPNCNDLRRQAGSPGSSMGSATANTESSTSAATAAVADPQVRGAQTATEAAPSVKCKQGDDSKFPLCHIAALRLQGTTFGLPDPSDTRFPFEEEFVFPGNLSTLRRAIEQASESESTTTKNSAAAKETRAAESEEPTEDWELIAWREPKHSSAVFRAGIHEAISRLSSRSSAHPRYEVALRLGVGSSSAGTSGTCGSVWGLGFGLIRERQVLAGASTPAYLTV